MVSRLSNLDTRGTVPSTSGDGDGKQKSKTKGAQMPQLNYLYTNPAWEHLLLMESHVMGSETISDRAMGECGSQPG